MPEGRVVIRRILRLLGPASGEGEAGDIVVGDFAEEIGGKRKGLVERIVNDHATIAYGKDHRAILPISILRKVKRGGDDLDRRKAR